MSHRSNVYAISELVRDARRASRVSARLSVRPVVFSSVEAAERAFGMDRVAWDEAGRVFVDRTHVAWLLDRVQAA